MFRTGKRERKLKTNHQRGFRDKRHSRAVFEKYYAGGSSNYAPLSGRLISACATTGDHANGKRGIARDVRGAKKYVRSRTRFHENAATKKLAAMAASDANGQD